MPAKKHHLAREVFFDSKVTTARSKQKLAAKNGSKEKIDMSPSTWQVQMLLLPP
jgi:hypothetical protein